MSAPQPNAARTPSPAAGRTPDAPPAPAASATVSGPLYVYDLPRAIVPFLGVRTLYEAHAAQGLAPAAGATAAAADGAPSATSAPREAKATLTRCTVCPQDGPFPSQAARRAHFRTDWHRYNLAARQRHAQLVPESEFERLYAQVEAEREQDEDSDEETDDILAVLLSRLEVQDTDEPNSEALDAALSALRSPIVWFESRADAPPEARLVQTQLGVYRDLLPDDVPLDGVLATLQLEHITRRPDRHVWTAKRVHGANAAGKLMHMSVVDGSGLLPELGVREMVAEDSESEFESTGSDVSMDESPPLEPLPPLRLWTFVLMGGGHFAAAVVALNPHVAPLSERARQRGARPERSIIVLAHKTFHRYTTRRKQGGSQSAHDTSGRHAKSAGANLRRYGEARLSEDVHDLLDRPGWRDLIGRSERIWVRAGIKAARGVLWHWNNGTSPLDAPLANGIVAHLPIPTQRPTLTEIMRCFFELTRVKTAHLTAEELAEQKGAQIDAISRALRADAEKSRPKAPAPQPAKKRIDTGDSVRRERIERLVAMVHKDKLATLVNFLERHEPDLLRPGGADAPQSEDMQARINAPLAQSGSSEGPTLLHIAAEAGHPDILHYLLVERRADPTIPVKTDGPHRTAYDLCTSKAGKAVFRRLMAEQPDWWNWGGMSAGGARVPSGLTAEMEQAQSSKTRTRRAAMRERLREREKDAGDADAEPEPAPEPAPTPAPAPASSTRRGPQTLGGTTPGSSMLETAGLSDEMRMRIEREKRARAAEARMQALKK